MKYIILSFILILCFSCQKSDKFILNAELTDIKDEAILVIYDDPVSKLDTILPTGGRFTYEITPDTVNLFRLISPENQVIPIIAEKGDKIKLTGTFKTPKIETKGANKEYGEFLAKIESMNGDTTAIAQEAENFIKSHPTSFTSAYLINQYFIQNPQADPKKIEKLIEPLNGNIKDSRILSLPLKLLTEKSANLQKTEYLNYYSYKDRNRKYVPWPSKDESYILINLWASWDKSSIEQRDSLFRMLDKLPKEQFIVLNISLDYDKEAWLNACKEDTKQWVETCDFKGWDNQIAKQNKINSLPADILVDRNRKVLGRNLFDTELFEKVKQLTKAKKNNK